MKFRFILAACACTTLVACSNAIPPSRSTSDLANTQAEFDRLALITDTVPAPGGTANFAGEIGSELMIDGESGGAFLGALALTVDFDNTTSGITGTISDITLFDDGDPDQNLGGSMTVSGAYATSMTATATGTLRAVEESGAFGLSGNTNVVLTMTGSLVDDAGTNTLVGDVSGSSVGNNNDFDVVLTGQNGFYAVQH